MNKNGSKCFKNDCVKIAKKRKKKLQKSVIKDLKVATLTQKN